MAAAKLQTPIPGALPCAPIALPSPSNSCHASDPPRAHAVPSVHTSSTPPFALAASRGCLRAPPSPGAAIGRGMRAAPASIAPKYTCPAASHAPDMREPDAAHDMLLIGQATIVHGSTCEAGH